MRHQSYYDKILFGRNRIACNSNTSKAFSVIFNDTRGFFPEIDIQPLIVKRYVSCYSRDYRKHENPELRSSLRRECSDLGIRGISKSAFRNWKIPQSYITGSFSDYKVPEKKELITLDTKPKKWIDYERSVENHQNQQLKTKKQNSSTKETNEKAKDTSQPISISKMLESASVQERRVILKSLFMSDPKSLKFSIRQALAPDAEKKIRNWLNVASNQDKKTAVNFFDKFVINKGLCDDDRYFIQHIVQLIKDDEDFWLSKPPHPQFSEPGDGTSRFKFIDLRSPEQRKQRWMYTTWNHMPPYQDSEVYQCTSSHYTTANKTVPSTYRIHPEMG